VLAKKSVPSVSVPGVNMLRSVCRTVFQLRSLTALIACNVVSSRWFLAFGLHIVKFKLRLPNANTYTSAASQHIAAAPDNGLSRAMGTSPLGIAGPGGSAMPSDM
jgi:hypothetical protein